MAGALHHDSRPWRRLRIIVLGYIVRGPLGGLAWHHLHYVLGLALLGHEVWFVEDSDDFEGCYDPSTDTTGADPGYGLRFAERAFARFGLRDRWAYHDAHRSRWHGPCAGDIQRICRQADLLLNVSGVNPIRPWVADIPTRVLIDTDPAFTQIRHLQDASAWQRAATHTAFFTFGENFGKPGCGVPDDGFPWQSTRQPVVLQAWPVLPPPGEPRYTTVMQWDSYRLREHEGKCYGMKSLSFEPYMRLPGGTAAILELAVGSGSAPRQSLMKHGWSLRNPLEVTRELDTYQRYIQGSRAEFSVAKHGYVASASGWFSERSANYLASGRPVLVQETGFSSWMHTGHGVVPFANPDEALDGIERIEGDYAQHCEAARALAEQYFESSAVLDSLIERALQSAPGAL